MNTLIKQIAASVAFVMLGGCVSYHATKREQLELYLNTLDKKHLVWCKLDLEDCGREWQEWRASEEGQAIIQAYEEEKLIESQMRFLRQAARVSRHSHRAQMSGWQLESEPSFENTGFSSGLLEGYQPDAYGFGVHADAFGRSFEWVDSHTGRSVTVNK